MDWKAALFLFAKFIYFFSKYFVLFIWIIFVNNYSVCIYFIYVLDKYFDWLLIEFPWIFESFEGVQKSKLNLGKNMDCPRPGIFNFFKGFGVNSSFKDIDEILKTVWNGFIRIFQSLFKLFGIWIYLWILVLYILYKETRVIV